MRRQTRKQSTRIGIVLLLVIVVWSLIAIRQQEKSWLVSAEPEGQKEDGREGELSKGESLLEEKSQEELFDLLGEKYLTISKTSQESGEVFLTEDEKDKKMTLTVTGTKQEDSSDWIKEVQSAGDFVTAVDTFYDRVTAMTELTILFDHLYVPFLYEDEESYYLALKRPREVYDRILVIDAGHGGKHPGTMSADRKSVEKDVNLEIVQALKERLDTREDIKVYYTRLEDESVYLRPRVELANEAEADFFISVHNNAFWNQSAHGTEVLYKKEENISRNLAEICLKEVSEALGTDARGIWEDDETYILKHAEVPTVLIEVAFLTNEEDLELLRHKEHLEQAAEGMYRAILKAYGEEED